MKRIIMWMVACALAHPAAAEGETMQQQEQAVLNTVMEMTAAFQSKDTDAVMTAYEPQAVVMFQPGEPVSDVAQISEMFAGMAAANPKFTYGGHEVYVQGNLAVHIAPWSMTGRLPDGTDIEQSGLSVAVLRQQADGDWKIVIDNPHGDRLLTGSR